MHINYNVLYNVFHHFKSYAQKYMYQVESDYNTYDFKRSLFLFKIVFPTYIPSDNIQNKIHSLTE